jgi:hypothetical protein
VGRLPRRPPALELTSRLKVLFPLQIRPDGQVKLHIHAEIATEDGEKIAFLGDGIIRPEANTALRSCSRT